MHRLLVGEVGSARRPWRSTRPWYGRGRPAALAPPRSWRPSTANFGRSLGRRGRIGVLVAGMGAARTAVLRAMEQGDLDLVIGTHALLSDSVLFSRLALVVIDEQHRFGVLQRQRLLTRDEAGRAPHRLLMTATPIPRTLERILWGDLDVSILEGLPPGRKPIATRWVAAADRENAYDAVRRELAAGRQAYVVCPRLVGEGEGQRSATGVAKKLAAGPFRRFRVELVHGRLKGPEKQAVMERFRAGRVQVLVATSVVEVGLDVPNATVMIVEEVDRFGLSQLHQLRGRIGRGEHASTCYLFADPKTPEGLSRMKAIVAKFRRLRAGAEGPETAGSGDWFGTEQSGSTAFSGSSIRRLTSASSSRPATTPSTGKSVSETTPGPGRWPGSSCGGSRRGSPWAKSADGIHRKDAKSPRKPFDPKPFASWRLGGEPPADSFLTSGSGMIPIRERDGPVRERAGPEQVLYGGPGGFGAPRLRDARQARRRGRGGGRGRISRLRLRVMDRASRFKDRFSGHPLDWVGPFDGDPGAAGDPVDELRADPDGQGEVQPP